MPQLDFFIFKNISITATIFFLLLSYIMYIYILPQLFKALKTRKELENFLNPISPEITFSSITHNQSIDALNQLNLQLDQRKTAITNININE